MTRKTREEKMAQPRDAICVKEERENGNERKRKKEKIKA